jgi:hypothetical protein
MRAVQKTSLEPLIFCQTAVPSHGNLIFYVKKKIKGKIKGGKVQIAISSKRLGEPL